MSTRQKLPRNTTLQADGLRYGDWARMTNRFTGIVIILFVLVHVVAQTVLHVPAFAGTKAQAPWLPALQNLPVIHAVLYFSIVFHTLWGFRLLLGDFGVRLGYRVSFLAVASVGCLFGLRELLRYAGL